MKTLQDFMQEAASQEHPLRRLDEFLERELRHEQARDYDQLRFVGYVLEIGFDTVTIMTSDPFKLAVGGVPRNSLLIMVPALREKVPPHFTLLRVSDSAATPLSKEIQQTYFELQKKSMPELDIFTQSELQWGALSTAILGMYYAHPDMPNAIEFSGDLNNFVAGHKYRVYAPDASLLDLIINALVPDNNRFPLGDLRLTECRLGVTREVERGVRVYVSADDFMGTRTAMFGKTRLGKSNVVKLISQSLIETTAHTRNVGQLIFDINGEYANDNPQDDNRSLKSAYIDRCVVYALTPKASTPSRPLKLNFYAQPDKSLPIVASLLRTDGKDSSSYVRSFLSVELPDITEVKKMGPQDKLRPLRKLQMYWAILKKANYAVDDPDLRRSIAPLSFDPGFAASLRQAVYGPQAAVPPAPTSLDDLVREMEHVAQFRRENLRSNLLTSSGSGNALFDADDIALLDFLDPGPGRTGVALIQPYRKYHDTHAGNFIAEILGHLDRGDTVILDLGNANPEVMAYFSDELSRAVFNHQVDKFSNNALGNHFVQLVFEEAHNLFPQKQDVTTIYSRFAKEGAKYHIGMVYSTQSPSTVSKDLLAQTENFFVAHLSSQDEVATLGKLNIAYDSVKGDILQARTPGYMRMLTRSHRFVVSVQARRFMPTPGGSSPDGRV